MIFNTLFQNLYTLIIDPFAQHAFLLRALLGCGALSLGCGAVGSFLTLRRMGLVADALSHGLFPGVAIAFLLAGFHMGLLSIGGALTATCLALVAERMTYHTTLTKDSVFSVLVFFSTAVALFILAMFGNYTDVMHILMGNVLALSQDNLYWLGGTASLTLVIIALIYRPLILKSFDPHFFKITQPRYGWVDMLFLLLVTLNTVCAFQALGSLLALGLLLIPAITARLLSKHIWSMCILSIGIAFLSSLTGILCSYYGGYPTGPAIILVTTVFYGWACLWRWKTKHLGIVRRIGLVAPFLLMPFYLTVKAQQLIHAHVVVSFTVLKDFVHVLTGQQLRVVSLAGANQDPHTFEPSPQDIKKLSQAQMVILNGLNLENHWLPAFLRTQTNTNVVVASADVKPRFFKIGKQDIPDPHAWHDVANAATYVNIIASALIKRWPHLEDSITKNKKRYLQELGALDQWIRQRIAAIKHTRRHVITTHDGFGYFEDAYGIIFLSPLGPSTNAEVSPENITNILQAAKEYNVRGIFFENMISQNLVRMLAKELNLRIGGTLYSDALSKPEEGASTYIKMMRHNLNCLLASL